MTCLVNESPLSCESDMFFVCVFVPEVLEEALMGSDPEGPLCELLFFFMSAIFMALAEEQEDVAREQLAEADTKGQPSLCSNAVVCCIKSSVLF